MGKIEALSLEIPFSQSPRKIWIYLPDSYQKSRKKYDVLYMFDGHNLFYDDLATYGKSWGMKKYLDITNLDIIVVGMDCNHHGNERLSEYCPFPPEKTRIESLPEIQAEGILMAQWIVQKLKPTIETHYRVHTHRKHIGIGGSSMGGLMSEYIIIQYNDLFSKAACVSPSTHFCFHSLKKLLKEKELNSNTFIYIDQGSQEVHGKKLFIDCIDMMLNMNHLFTDARANTYPHLTPGGHHCEADWERVIPIFLHYLYPDLYKNKNRCSKSNQKGK